jgi:hypothetical protein
VLEQSHIAGTLEAFRKPYRLTIWLYATLFVVSVGLFLAAAVIGLRKSDTFVAIAFAGLSVATFLTFCGSSRRISNASLEFGAAFNTY